MRTHTITTQARVGGRGRMKRRIVPGAILALSLAIALLAATASSASWAPGATSEHATWVCPLQSTPPTTIPGPERCYGSPHWSRFDFGYHLVGTSTSQRFELGVHGGTGGNTFSPAIGVSGDYAQTNNCPPTLSAAAYQIGGACLVTVTFTPTGERTGPRPGTLTTGPGGPTMALTGNGERRDSVPPDLRLSGPKKQSPQNPKDCANPKSRSCKHFDPCYSVGGHPCRLEVRVSCDGLCTVRVTGKLTNVKMDKLDPVGYDFVPEKRPFNFGPELAKRKQREQVRQALDEGKNVQAKVTVRARDLSGNVATAKRTITLVK